MTMKYLTNTTTLLLASGLAAGPAAAATWTVDPSGVLSEVCAAVAIASPGDTIVVLPGTYLPFDLGGKELIIEAEDPTDKPVIDFLKSNGGWSFTECMPTGPTHGVTIAGGQTAATVIDGLVIINGSAPMGGGVFVSGASPVIANCEVRGNSASGDGGGLFFEDSTSTIYNTLVTENDASRGGGIAAIDASITIATNSEVSHNTALEFGGGFYGESLDDVADLVAITDTTIIANGADTGGGISVVGGSSGFVLTLMESSVIENLADTDGGGIYIAEFVRLAADYADVSFNSAGIRGGGVMAQFTLGSSFSNSTFEENVAQVGAGLHLSHPIVEDRFVNALVVENDASFVGGGLYLEEAEPTVVSSTIAHNTAVDGGGVFVSGGSLGAAIDSSIVFFNTPNALSGLGVPPVTSFSDIEGGAATGTNLASDPLFATGPGSPLQPQGEYYLDQVASPCIDAGDPMLALDLPPYPGTTSTALTPDSLVADMGFHYDGVPVPPQTTVLTSTFGKGVYTPTPGASLTFTVKTPPTGSGQTQFAVITGSLTGTSPGFVVDGLVVPAAFDAYSMALLNTPLAIFPGGTVVSPLPNGSATFSLDESVLLTPGLAGSEVVHAVVIIELDLVTGIPVVVSVSNPLTLQL